MPQVVARAARRARGFSLVELMIGLAIFSTSLLMILGIFPTSSRSIQQARTILLGTHVAEQLVEQYGRGLPFSQVVNRTSGANDPVTGTPLSPINLISTVNGTQRVITFNWQIVVTTVNADLKDVRCQVSWLDTDQASTSLVRYVNLSTRVANL